MTSHSFVALTLEISCSTLEINLLFPRTYVVLSMYIVILYIVILYIIILYNVQCTLYIVHCTLYIVHCTLYIVHCTLSIVHCTLHIAHCTLYIVHCTLYIVQYYTSNSNCPIKKLSLCHVSVKLITISRLTSSISEPAFLLFPGEHGVEHYSRRPRETTRMTTTWPTKYK